MPRSLRLLLIEDVEDDALVLEDVLRRATFVVHAHRVETANDFIAALAAEEWDLIISDFSLPTFSAPAALELLKGTGKEIPFLIVSGTIGEERAIAALRAGASDFISKGNWARLVPAIERELADAKVRQERKRAERELHETALELARANRELTAQAELLNSMLESVAEGIIVADAESNVTLINPAAERILGARKPGPGAPLDLPHLEVRHADTVTPMSRERRPLQRALEGHFVDALEIFLFHKQSPDAHQWIEASSRPLHTSDSKPHGAVVVLRDVTARKKAERVIAEQQLQLVATQKLSELGEMAASIAHEIANPLAIISALASHLRSALGKAEPPSPQSLQLAAKIETNVTRIAKILQGLRAMSRKAEQDPPEPTSVSRLLEDVLALCQARLDSQNVELRVEPLDAELKILCRPSEIMQVLLNLLTNAGDAVENLNERWIKMGASRRGSEVEITVTDSGPGIPAELKARIVEPFFTTKPAGKGTGLGLSISKRIIESHEGAFVIDAPEGNTRFLIRLPAAVNEQRKAA